MLPQNTLDYGAMVARLTPDERRQPTRNRLDAEQLRKEWEQWRHRRSQLPENLRGPMLQVGQRECRYCGDHFTPVNFRQRFCTPRCRKLAHKYGKRWDDRPALGTPPPQEGRECAHCGTVFTPIRSTRRFCSNSCRQAAYRQRTL
jgi:predicted nucleic acid-binding Zn ribbon protein